MELRDRNRAQSALFRSFANKSGRKSRKDCNEGLETYKKKKESNLAYI